MRKRVVDIALIWGSACRLRRKMETIHPDIMSNDPPSAQKWMGATNTRQFFRNQTLSLKNHQACLYSYNPVIQAPQPITMKSPASIIAVSGLRLIQ